MDNKYRPTEQELELINSKFAKEDYKSVDDLYVFPSMIVDNQMTAYYTKIHPDFLKQCVKDLANGVAFLVGHDKDKLPMAKSFKGTSTNEGEVMEVFAKFFMQKDLDVNGINTDDFMKAYKGGTIEDVSIGFAAKSWICSICENDIRSGECKHWPGLRYNDKDEEVKKGGTQCFAWVKDPAGPTGEALLEVSACYKGAVPNAKLKKPEETPQFTIELAAGKNLKEMPLDAPIAVNFSIPISEEYERGKGKGKGGEKQGDGGAKYCKCPKCGYTVDHAKGKPCQEIPCAKCGAKMVGTDKKNSMEFLGYDKLVASRYKDEGKVLIDMEQIQNLGEYNKNALSLVDADKNNRDYKEDCISDYLDEKSYEQKIVEQSYSYFKLALISKAVKEYQKQNGWSCDDTLNIDKYTDKRTRPVYSKLPTSRKANEELLIDGFYCLGKDNNKIVVGIRPYMFSFGVTIYANKNSGDLVDKFVEGYENYAKDNNFLRGEKITPQGKFLSIPETLFSDIKLKDDEKQAIKVGIFEFFKKKEIYSKNKIPFKRGLIFAGEPGTGKTMVGKALMNETKNTFIWVTAKDLLTYYGGIDPAAFGRLLSMAQELAPSVLFAEDVDDYLAAKSSVDTIKTQMDGLDSMDGVVTVLCTNYPEDIPNSLIDRPSRFDDIVIFGLPDVGLRYEILDVNLQGVSIKNRDEVLKKISENSEGLTGAHLKEVALYAMLLASDGDKEEATESDFIKALDKVKKARELVAKLRDQKKLKNLNYETTAQENKELKAKVETSDTNSKVAVGKVTKLEKDNEELVEKLKKTEEANLKLQKEKQDLEPKAKEGEEYRKDIAKEILELGVKLNGNAFDKGAHEKTLKDMSLEDMKKMKVQLWTMLCDKLPPVKNALGPEASLSNKKQESVPDSAFKVN